LQEQGRLLLVDLLRRLERAPLRRQERVLLQGLVQTQVRGLLRQRERRLLRYEGRVRFRAQVQHRNLMLLGFEYRRLVRGPSMGPERWLSQRPERLPFPTLWRPQERGPFRGQGLPQRSRGREKLGQCRSQNADARSQNSWKGKGLEHEGEAEVKRQKPRAKSQNRGHGTMNEERCTMYDVWRNEPCYVWGSWFL